MGRRHTAKQRDPLGLRVEEREVQVAPDFEEIAAEGPRPRAEPALRQSLVEWSTGGYDREKAEGMAKHS